MKLIAAIAVASALLISDSGPEPTGPQFQGEYAEVPDPVPVGYQRCVTAVTNPGYEDDWNRIAVYPPPLDELDAKTLNFMRGEGIARLKHCAEEKA